MKGTLSVMDRTGHTEIMWDTENPTGPLDPAVAQEKFDEMVQTGAMVYDMDEEKRIERFDPEEQKNVLVVPQFVGG